MALNIYLIFTAFNNILYTYSILFGISAIVTKIVKIKYNTNSIYQTLFSLFDLEFIVAIINKEKTIILNDYMIYNLFIKLIPLYLM